MRGDALQSAITRAVLLSDGARVQMFREEMEAQIVSLYTMFWVGNFVRSLNSDPAFRSICSVRDGGVRP